MSVEEILDCRKGQKVLIEYPQWATVARYVLIEQQGTKMFGLILLEVDRHPEQPYEQLGEVGFPLLYDS